MKRDNKIQQMIVLSEDLIDFCSPLHELGIHLFNVMINYDDDGQIYLCNNPQWVHDYYHYQLHQSSFYDNTPSLFSTEYDLWPDHFDQPILIHGLSYYDNKYGVTVCHRKEDHTAFYFFTGSHRHNHLPHFFINHFTFLEQFISYFMDKKAQLISQAHSVSLKRSIKEKRAPWGDNVVSKMQKQKNKLDMQSKLSEFNYLLNSPDAPLVSSFSLRQRQVLHGRAQGKSAKQIAQELGISHRTVERHFVLLKNKFPNYSYVELLLQLLDAEPNLLLVD